MTAVLPVGAPTPVAQGDVVILSGVERSYSGGGVQTPVLRGVDLRVAAGSMTVILGASGSGKTTLLNIIGAIDHADRGTVRVDGVELSRASAADLVRYRRQRIGFIFQFYNLMPTLTAQENVEVALEHGALAAAERGRRARDMLEAVGLGAHAAKFPAQLSGGEQQRVACARALVRRPRILLCDEPTGNLDADSGAVVVELIDRLRREVGSTAIVVTHNPDLFPNPDRIVHIKDGVIV